VSGQEVGLQASGDLNTGKNGTIPWVSPKDMKIDKINKTIDKITLNAVKESVAKLIPPCVRIVVT